MDLLVNQYNTSPQVYDFLFDLFCSIQFHPKLYLISPQIDLETNPDKLKKLIARNSKKNVNESAEYAKILDYVMNGNYFRIRQLSLPDINIDSFKLKFYTLDYTADQEEKFKTPFWLYHGSSFHSWFFIIKNGLKVLSHTSLQANGAAYGPGIYMSNNFQTSAMYCGTNFMDGRRVIGVFQLNTDPAKFKKTSGIYVVPNESHLLLRFLVVVDTTLTDLSFMDGLIGDIITKIGFSTSKVSDVITNKRLEVEYTKLKSNEKVLAINVLEQDKLWKVLLASGSELEILFSKYPINPPVIKLNNEVKKLNILHP